MTVWRDALGLACTVLAASAVWVGSMGAAVSQGLDLGGDGEPVQIEAINGIEWQRDRGAYIARGNATATRGDVSIRADTLSAFYDPEAEDIDIYRIDAVGNVVITTANEQVTGQNGVYDVVNGVAVLTGDNLRLSTPTEWLTARDSLEYWEQEQMAVARGDAVACTGTERLAADILTAYFADEEAAPGEGDERAQNLDRVEAFGGVDIITPTERLLGDQGIYYARTGIAELSGNVRISQGNNQMVGGSARYDLNTGIFQMTAAVGRFVNEEEATDGEVPCVVEPPQ